MREQRKFIDLITTRLASELGITVEVKLVEGKSLERFEGKAKRVVEKRNF
jgi:phenylacetate-CoA ligase